MEYPHYIAVLAPDPNGPGYFPMMYACHLQWRSKYKIQWATYSSPAKPRKQALVDLRKDIAHYRSMGYVVFTGDAPAEEMRSRQARRTTGKVQKPRK